MTPSPVPIRASLSPLLVALLLAAPAAAAGPPERSEPPAADPWASIWDYRHADVVAAREAFEAAHRADPDDAGATAGLAASLAIGLRFSWEGNGVLERADTLSRRAVERDPARDQTQIARALVELLLLDFRSAEERSRRVLEKPDPIGAARLSLGDALLQQGRWREAEETFQAALDAAPQSCPARSGLAAALRQQERYLEAYRLTGPDVPSVIECYPALLDRAATAHLAGRSGYALRLLAHLLERFPASGNLTRLNYAAILLHLDRPREALATYRGLALPPRPARLRLLRDLGESESLRRLDFRSEAIEGYRALLRTFPPSTGGDHLRSRLLFPAYRELADLYRDQGEQGAEIEVLEQASRQPDAPGQILRRLGDAYSSLGLGDSAADAYRRALAADRFDSLYEEGRALLSWLRAQRSDPSPDSPPDDRFGPVRRFERRVKEEGRSSSYYALARALALAGRGRASIAALEKAVQEGYRDHRALRREPDLDPIRGRRRFARLVTRLEEGGISAD